MYEYLNTKGQMYHVSTENNLKNFPTFIVFTYFI